MQINYECPLCREESENINHLFKECSRAREVWRKAKELKWLKEEPQGPIKRWLKNLRAFRELEDEEEQATAATIIWSIWKSRNNKIFRNEEFNANGVLVRARSMIKEWKITSNLLPGDDEKGTGRRIKASFLVKWEPPPLDYVKVNFDGSVKDNNGASGYVIRNHFGKIVAAGVGATNLGLSSVLLAEATGLRDGVRKAIELGYRKLEVEGDSMVVIQALRGEIEKP